MGQRREPWKRAVWNIGPIGQIPPGEGRAFRIGELLVAVFRGRGGGLFATQALCPHRAGPLTDGIIGGGTVICPLHSYKFDLATGQPIGSDCAALKTYAVARNEAGDILLDLGG